MYALLHSQPVLVTDGDAAVTPLVVICTTSRIAKRFLGTLKQMKDALVAFPLL